MAIILEAALFILNLYVIYFRKIGQKIEAELPLLSQTASRTRYLFAAALTLGVWATGIAAAMWHRSMLGLE